MDETKIKNSEVLDNDLSSLDEITYEEASDVLEKMKSNTNWTDTTKHLMREASWSGC